MRYRYSRFLPGFILLCDLLLLDFAFYFPVYHNIPNLSSYGLLLLLVANVSWIALSPIFKVYHVSRPPLLKDDVVKCIQTTLSHLIIIAIVCYNYWTYDVRLSSLLFAYLIFTGLVVAHRYALSNFLDFIRLRGYNGRTILILGDRHITDTLIAHFNVHPEYGYDIIQDHFGENIGSFSDEEITHYVLNKNPDEIFICYLEQKPHLIEVLSTIGITHQIKIKLVSNLILTNSYARIVNYDNLPILQVKQELNLSKYNRVAKRSFDIGFSFVALMGSVPLFALLYVVTRTTSRGPAFYKQERVGLNGKPFKIIKFRSMFIDAEYGGPQLACHNDPRVTAWGRIMRRTRLDELPQFWNVLRGDMSIVGPRPERDYFIEKISARNPHYRQLLAIKPGITSLGQVHYGYAANVDQMCERLEYDLLYLHNIGLKSDIKVIANTVKVMIQGKGM